MDLARQILIELEESPAAIGDMSLNLEIEGRTPAEITYHVMLLNQAGLITAKSERSLDEDGYGWYPKGLTWQGHEFLDASRGRRALAEGEESRHGKDGWLGL
jgi:DNA-binding transcriptional ArsR family regulator